MAQLAAVCYAYPMAYRTPIAIWAAVGITLALVAAAWRGWPDPVVAIDVEQTRRNILVSPPQPGAPIAQTFTPSHNGLSQISVWLAMAQSEGGAAASATVTVIGPDGLTLATRVVRPPDIPDPSSLSLHFEPQPASAGEPYQIVIAGRTGNQIAPEGYTLNTVVGGHLSGPDLNGAQVLRFTSRYTLTWREGVAAAGRLAGRWWLILLTGAALIPLPGALLLSLGRPRWPAAVYWGASWAAGIATWPLLWAALTAVGGRWSAWTLWILVGAGWPVVVWRSWDRLRQTRWGEPLALSIFCIFVLAVRLVAIRDAVTLPWVDASRHALITALMREQGQLLTSYRPLLPVDLAPYHYGLHTLTAGVGLLVPSADLIDILPAIMQLLSAVICLAIFSGGWLLTGRRRVGWIAAFLVGLPFFFPGYYTTWGRLTQLAGLVILPVLLGVTWRLRAPASGRILAALFAVLTAGLFYTHIRVFLLFVPYFLLVTLLALRPWRPPPVRRRTLIRWCAALAGAAGLALPRALVLLRHFAGYAAVQPADAGGAASAFPTGYLNTGWETVWWPAAAAGLLIFLIIWISRLGRQRLVHAALLLGLWVGVLVVLIGGSNLHPGWPIWLPQVTVNSAYISLFVPQALLLAAAADWLVTRALRWGPARGPVSFLLAGGVTLTALFGVYYQADILNHQTLLMQPTDLAAIGWLDDNLPAEATIAHGSWEWLERVWAGRDGGAWILPLTGRRTTAPPIDHTYNPDLLARTIALNHALAEVENFSSPETTALLDQFGVTHVFVGVRSGPLDPAALAANPAWEMIYHHGGTFIFARSP